MNNYAFYKINMGLFKSRYLNMDEIVKLVGYPSCVLNQDFIKSRYGTGKYTILFNKDKVGKGIELSIEKNYISICVLFPLTKYDLDLLYDVIKKLCNHFKTKSYLRTKDKLYIKDIDNNYKDDLKLSNDLLTEMKNKLYFKGEEYIHELLAFNPIDIGKDEIDYIDGSLDKYADLLHLKQNCSALFPYITTKKRVDGSIYSYFSAEFDCRLILKKNPKYIVDDTPIKEYYVKLPNFNLIPYYEFLDKVKNTCRYDETSDAYTIYDFNIKDLIKDGVTEAVTKSTIKGYYFDTILDDGFNHFKKIENFKLKVDMLSSLSHIAVFYKYAHNHNMLTDEFYEAIPDFKKYIDSNSDLRILIKDNPILNGFIYLGIFKDEYKPFVKNYYRYGTEDGYLAHVDLATKEIFKKDFNNKKYNGQTYLFNTYDDNYYNVLSSYIDIALSRFNKTNHINKVYTYLLDDSKAIDRDLIEDKIKVPKYSSYNHMVSFFMYFYNINKIDKTLLKNVPEIKEYIDNNKDLRELFYNNKYLDKSLYLEYFTSDVQDFIKDYYLYIKNNGTSYIDDVKEYASNNAKPKDDIKLHLLLEYTDDYKKYLYDKIDTAFKNYNK